MQNPVKQDFKNTLLEHDENWKEAGEMWNSKRDSQETGKLFVKGGTSSGFEEGNGKLGLDRFPQYDIIGSPVLLDGLLMSIDSDLATNISWTYLWTKINKVHCRMF